MRPLPTPRDPSSTDSMTLGPDPYSAAVGQQSHGTQATSSTTRSSGAGNARDNDDTRR